jgi:hypothetical protein
MLLRKIIVAYFKNQNASLLWESNETEIHYLGKMQDFLVFK